MTKKISEILDKIHTFFMDDEKQIIYISISAVICIFVVIFLCYIRIVKKKRTTTPTTTTTTTTLSTEQQQVGVGDEEAPLQQNNNSGRVQHNTTTTSNMPTSGSSSSSLTVPLLAGGGAEEHNNNNNNNTAAAAVTTSTTTSTLGLKASAAAAAAAATVHSAVSEGATETETEDDDDDGDNGIHGLASSNKNPAYYISLPDYLTLSLPTKEVAFDVFDKADVNNDMVLSLGECEKVCRTLFHGLKHKASIRRAYGVATMKYIGAGLLKRNDFEVFIRYIVYHNDAYNYFCNVRTNAHTSKMNASEFANVSAQLGLITYNKNDVDEVFQLMDDNNTGSVTFDEYCTYIAQNTCEW